MKPTGENDAIPDGWQRVRLGAVARLGAGKAPTYDNENGTVTVLGSNGPIGLAHESNFSNGIVVGRVGASGSVSHVKEAVWLSDNVLFVETKGEVWDLSYLYNALQTANLPALASKTAQPLLTQKELGAVKVLLPPLPEQRAIASVLDSIDGAIEGAEAVIAATERLRDALLHDLLTRGLPGQHTEWRNVPGLGTIPADWDVVRLGEVAEVVMGQSPPGMHCNRDGEGVPLLNGPTEYGPNHPEPAQWTTDAKKMSREGDVLFCVRGATAGKMNWADRNYAIGRGVAAIRHRSGSSFQRFLRAVVDFYLPTLLSVVTGSTFPNLSCDQITQLRVPGIPIVEQQAIAAALTGVDGAIEVEKDEAARLRLLKESTVEALLTGRVQVRSSSPH